MDDWCVMDTKVDYQPGMPPPRPCGPRLKVQEYEVMLAGTARHRRHRESNCDEWDYQRGAWAKSQAKA